MNSQDKLRTWTAKLLDARQYGARARLAEFLNLTPMQISNMLNTRPGRKNRNILADEWLKILLFFGIEESNPDLPRALLKKGKPVITLPVAFAAENQAGRAALIELYDSAAPRDKRAMIEFARILLETRQNPRRRA